MFALDFPDSGNKDCRLTWKPDGASASPELPPLPVPSPELLGAVPGCARAMRCNLKTGWCILLRSKHVKPAAVWLKLLHSTVVISGVYLLTCRVVTYGVCGFSPVWLDAGLVLCPRNLHRECDGHKAIEHKWRHHEHNGWALVVWMHLLNYFGEFWLLDGWIEWKWMEIIWHNICIYMYIIVHLYNYTYTYTFCIYIYTGMVSADMYIMPQYECTGSIKCKGATPCPVEKDDKHWSRIK